MMRVALRRMILETGRTQREIAMDARIAETRISDIIRCRTDPKPHEEAALIGLLGGTREELFEVSAITNA